MRNLLRSRIGRIIASVMLVAVFTTAPMGCHCKRCKENQTKKQAQGKAHPAGCKCPKCRKA